MKDHPEQAPAQFLKLLDIAERQKRVVDQWRRAQALGPTDDQLWEAELERHCGRISWPSVKGRTVGHFPEFSKALAFELKANR